MATGEHACNITLFLSNTQTEIIYDLSKIATKIALQYFDWRYITFVYLNTTLWFGADFFLKSYSKDVAIGKGTFYPRIAKKTRQYVLFGNSVNSIMDTLEWMRTHEFDNTGKYIIVCQSLDVQECDETAAISLLWEYKITNVIFLKSDENEAAGFTYFPLNNNACIYDFPVRLVNLKSCLDSINFQGSCNLFPIKLLNLNACPLIVSTFVQKPYMTIENGVPSGSDGDLLCLVAEKLNGNLTVMTPRIGYGWGKLESNGTWSGSLADVYYDYANFSITSAALTLSRFSFFQLSIDYNAASVVWITHSAKKVPSSLKLTYPFQENAQIAIVISFAIVIICSIVIHSKFWLRFNQKMELKNPCHETSIVFYSWVICMGSGVPTTRLPTKTALLYIVIIWMWYCILIRTFYQVSLITAMKSNYYYKEFETIDDAIEAKYPFGGGAALKDYYMDYPNVLDHWINVETPDIIPTLRKVSQGMEFVLAMNMETAKTIAWDEKLHVHMLARKVVTSPTVIFFKKYSPLADAVNSVLVRLTESGFPDMLYKNHATRKLTHETGNSVESIKLKHYTGCYAVLITGWIVSYLLFVAEILYDKICRQQLWHYRV